MVLAALISAPTGWGQTRHPEDDGLTNTAGLLYLVFFTAVAQLGGMVVAVVAAVVSRFVRPRVADRR